MRILAWPVLLGAMGGCSLVDTPLPGETAGGGDAAVGEDGGGEGEAGPGDGGGDVDAGGDAGTGCTIAVSAPAEVTLGTRVPVTSGLACADDPAGHTCSWRAEWNDGNDDVTTITTGDHPCAPGELFTFAAAAVSDDASSFYRVSLALDGVVVPGRGRANVFVGGFRAVAGTKAALVKVQDIAFDPQDHVAWLAASTGLAAMRAFDGPEEEVLLPPAGKCNDDIVHCNLLTVAVADGFAWAGSGADLAEIVRGELDGGDIDSVAVSLPEKAKVRSIVASRADGDDDEPGLYITSDVLTYTLDVGHLDDDPPAVEDVLSTDGDDLETITSSDVEVDGDDEALWRMETGGGHEVQRLETIGSGLDALLGEDVLDHSGSSIAVFGRLVVLAQRDDHAFAIDLDDIDTNGDEPLVDASRVLELPVVDEADETDILEDVLDLHVGEDRGTLWAVSADTLYRITGGTIFRSSVSDLPDTMRCIAVFEDAAGAEVILIGTDAGLFLSRANLHD